MKVQPEDNIRKGRVAELDTWLKMAWPDKFKKMGTFPVALVCVTPDEDCEHIDFWGIEGNKEVMLFVADILTSIAAEITRRTNDE